MTSRFKALLTPYLFLAPALLVLIITVFRPALQAFQYSFVEFDYSNLSEATTWVGLANFRRLIKDDLFWKTLKHMVLYTVCVVPLLATLPLGLAIMVNQRLRGVNWFRVAYYAPVVVSIVVAGLAWKWLYVENGLFNQSLSVLAGSEVRVPWLTRPEWALYSVMVVTVWKGLGYYMVIYLAGLQSLPADLYEAAAIDGSDGWRKHWDITVPLMKPYILLVTVISAIASTKVFEEVFVMTQGGPRNASKTPVYYIYESAFSDTDYSYACTIGLALFLIVVVLSAIRLVFFNPGDSGTQL